MMDLRKIVAAGRDAYQSGDFTTAEKFLIQALENRDDMADVHNMLGVIYSQTDRINKAKISFEQAIIINPGYTDAALNLAVTYNELGKYEEARRVYTRAMRYSRDQPQELDPFIRGKLANMHANLGEVYKELGMFDESIIEYNKALKLSPSFIDIRTRLSEVYREMGDIKSSEAELEHVIEKNPNYSPALIALGVNFFSLGEYEKAKTFFAKVALIDPLNRSVGLYLKMIERNTIQKDDSVDKE
jgi:tetratricopeptide (TPR) repeat protein